MATPKMTPNVAAPEMTPSEAPEVAPKQRMSVLGSQFHCYFWAVAPKGTVSFGHLVLFCFSEEDSRVLEDGDLSAGVGLGKERSQEDPLRPSPTSQLH